MVRPKNKIKESMRKIVAGNWKMNMNYHEASKLLDNIIIARTSIPEDVSLIIAPPSIYLSEFSSAIRDYPKLFLAAQNCSDKKNGAYTGEISAAMLSSMGITFCIVGHSERREYFGEQDVDVNAKVKALLAEGLQPIVCIGESLNEREEDRFKAVVCQQIEGALKGLSKAESSKIIWAYEPIWAIGTGKTASSEQAQEIHAIIKDHLNTIGMDNQVPILYGGSCKPDNAKELFACPDVDGGLIGGASLVAEDFLSIANSF